MLRRITKIDKSQFVNYRQDIIRVDVPLMIRLLEYARETVKDDAELHKITEKLIKESKEEVVTMDDYYEIIGEPEKEVTPVLSEKSTLFRMDSRTLWSRFGWSPLNYSIALNNNIEGLLEVENRAYKHATRIGNFVVPYYGAEVGKTLGDALIEFARIAINVMIDLKEGIPLDGTKTKWDQSIENIATFLSTINPEYWPKEPVKSYFDALANFWIDSINARQAKDFAADSAAMDGIEKLVTLGSSDLVSLADVFSTGVIAQHPEKFID